LLVTNLIHKEISQHMIEAVECIIISVIMLYLQTNIRMNWEDHKLPFKMKDTKSNFLFKRLRIPADIEEMEKFLKLEPDQDFMPAWDKYLKCYKFEDIYLDNKLEELLNIFGKRQCKSCIEFETYKDEQLLDD